MCTATWLTVAAPHNERQSVLRNTDHVMGA